MESIALYLLALPFVLIVFGMSSESIVMVMVNASRRRSNPHPASSGWSATWKSVFPPPPNESDPPKLRLAYKIASRMITVGFIGIGCIVALVGIAYVVTHRGN